MVLILLQFCCEHRIFMHLSLEHGWVHNCCWGPKMGLYCCQPGPKLLSSAYGKCLNLTWSRSWTFHWPNAVQGHTTIHYSPVCPPVTFTPAGVSLSMFLFLATPTSARGFQSLPQAAMVGCQSQSPVVSSTRGFQFPPSAARTCAGWSSFQPQATTSDVGLQSLPTPLHNVHRRGPFLFSGHLGTHWRDPLLIYTALPEFPHYPPPEP